MRVCRPRNSENILPSKTLRLGSNAMKMMLALAKNQRRGSGGVSENGSPRMKSVSSKKKRSADYDSDALDMLVIRLISPPVESRDRRCFWFL